ncbi:MAG: cupredoxin domain-containing protein [Thaumarchaeota archaeon]|nr:cupredoxin domain-containing protein [Nitrososphaerota archaeon]
MGAPRKGLSTAGTAIIVLMLGVGVVSTVYISSAQSGSDQLSSQSQQIASLKLQLQQLVAEVNSGSSSGNTRLTLPIMNQTPTIRSIRETWYLTPAAHQDRFDPSFVIVNQGDNVRITLIDNDTVAHDFVVGPPYNIVVNATVPGLVNDLTGQTFTTAAKNNSPGVSVTGKPGSVQAGYSFVAKYSGIYEFVCTYHAEVGMIGYLVVLPNAAYNSTATGGGTGPGTSPKTSMVTMVSGAGTDTSITGYSPDGITVVIGVNNTVQWTNGDSSPHTVTANDGSFYSGNMAPGGTFSYTFARAGVYQYHCTYHPWMIGTVTVKASG